MNLLRHPRRDEDGAVAVMFSVLMVVMLGLVAVVLELGALRADRRNAQSTADFAATAGAIALRAVEGGVVTGNPREACDTAWRYFLANTPTADADPDSDNPCGGFPTDADACDPSDPFETVGVAPPYAIRILWPVPDDDAMMDLAGHDPGGYESDGMDPCERLGVWITRGRGFVFGGVVGQIEGLTGAPAVARSRIAERGAEFASLLLLEKTGCGTAGGILNVAGGGQLRVVSTWSPPDPTIPGDEGAWIKGRITLDTDAEGCGGQTALQARGGGGSILSYGCANPFPNPANSPLCSDTASTEGTISIFGLPSSDCDSNTNACQETDVITSPTPPPYTSYSPASPQPEGVWPQPIPQPKRINREAADHRYNCKLDYSVLDGTAPGGINWDVEPCEEGIPAYKDQLVSRVGDGSSTPSGFIRWQDVFDKCDGGANVKAGAPPPSSFGFTELGDLWNRADLPGNWHVDCNTFTLNNAAQIVGFRGGNVVFADRLVINNGLLRFNFNNPTDNLTGSCATDEVCIGQSSEDAAFVYIRDRGAGTCNGINQSGGKIEFRNTFVYLADGCADLSGSASYDWIAPLEGPFEDLALWSDGNMDGNSLAGQGVTITEGVFFTPNSNTSVSGGSGSTPKKAQFFTWNLKVTGGGAVVMEPAPDRGLPVAEFEGVSLIR